MSRLSYADIIGRCPGTVLSVILLALPVSGAAATEEHLREHPAVSASASAVTMPEPTVPAATDYLIGPGDLLEIAVWKDEALTKSVTVLPDGKITFPLVGDLVAAGKSTSELKQELARLLARYVPDLVLSVEVKQSNSMLVYVIGRVNQPGRLLLNTRINLLQALAMAGGFTPYAEKNRVKVFRQENGATRIHQFRYTDVVDGRRLDDNIELKRGDVIVVP